MQERLQRQEIIRFGHELREQKRKLENRLSLIEQRNQEELRIGIGAFSVPIEESLEDFNEPIFRRIRRHGGFF